MAPRFRALISVPITAGNDDDTINAANEMAHSITDPAGGGIAVGHVELLGELRGSATEIARVVHAEPAFLRQRPPDWKPQPARLAEAATRRLRLTAPNTAPRSAAACRNLR